MKIVIKDQVTEIDPTELEGKEEYDMDFNGEYLVKIEKENGQWITANAINGWGINCWEEFKGEKVIIIN